MLVKEWTQDIEMASGKRMTVYLYAPNLKEYPSAKWPGVICFTEIYQNTPPVARFASNIASQGYVVAVPSSFMNFEGQGSEAIPYDTTGTDLGNKYKAEKSLESYDEDATKTLDLLQSLEMCTGRIASTGMCLGGHLALRAALDPRVLSSFCFFATDVHSRSLGAGAKDDTLIRIASGELDREGRGCEVGMVFGKQDTHVDRAGRSLIRDTMDDAGASFSFYEVQAQHAFIRDDSSKGRWDAALTKEMFSVMLELFNRTVARDLGPRSDKKEKPEHVC